jgi:DtxR family manganese transport transcriptional regulator
MRRHSTAGAASEPKPGAPRSAATQAAALRRTRLKNAVETAQDYVEAIADLSALYGEARVVDLARRLGVSHVTAIRTVARLQRDGYVSARPYRSIFLTGRGAQLAEESRQRHGIVLDFLLGLGVPEEVAQADAEGIEHHVSPETLAAFKRCTAAKA